MLQNKLERGWHAGSRACRFCFGQEQGETIGYFKKKAIFARNGEAEQGGFADCQFLEMDFI